VVTADLDNNVRVAIYRFFVDRGRPPVAAEVSDSVGASVVEVENAYRRLHEAHVLVLAPGTPYIWMANPLSALPTPYTAHARGKTFFTSCVWDALGAVAMLGSEGSVEARCGDCGEVLGVDISGGKVVSSDHVVHFAVPAAQWWDEIGFA
jgi:hypothetical protein